MDGLLPIYLALAIAIGIWSTVLSIRLPSIHACLAAIIAVSCFGVAFGHWDIGPITASADRLFIVALLAFSVGKRLLTVQPRIRFDRTDWVLASFLLLLFVSVLSHPWAVLFPGDMPPWYRFLSSFAVPAAIYWIMKYRTWDQSDAKRICGFCILFGLYLAVTAIGEVHGITAIVYPRYILEPRELYSGRAVGPFHDDRAERAVRPLEGYPVLAAELLRGDQAKPFLPR